jgi:hypothetical protein
MSTQTPTPIDLYLDRIVSDKRTAARLLPEPWMLSIGWARRSRKKKRGRQHGCLLLRLPAPTWTLHSAGLER